MENFKNTLDYCGLSDVHCNGPIFTWNNGKEGIDFTMERLDRVLANLEWHNLFPNVVSTVDLATFSDHLSLTIDPMGCRNVRRRGRRFRYEAGWGENLECKKIIKKIWRVKEKEQGTWKRVEKKLKKSRGGFVQW